MSDQIRIELSALDIGQLIDGLENRAESWERTAAYLGEDGMPDDELFIIEECSDADEARMIAEHYRSIIAKMTKQIGEESC